MVIIAHCRKASTPYYLLLDFSTSFNQHQLLRTPSNQVTDTCDVSACRTDQRISRASKFPTWWDTAALAFLVGRKQGATKVDLWSTTYILRHVDMKPESHLQQRFLELQRGQLCSMATGNHLFQESYRPFRSFPCFQGFAWQEAASPPRSEWWQSSRNHFLVKFGDFSHLIG